jgi:helicase MOV-10
MVGFTSVLDLGVDPEEIGVIAPYKAQVRSIRERLNEVNLSNISVGSVEQFQGQVCVDYMSMREVANSKTGLLNQERKVIIMATTRSNEEYHPRRALGFLMNPRHINGQQFPYTLMHLDLGG